MTKHLTSLAHHRNGVCGEPFYVATFRDDDGSRKAAITFHHGGSGHCGDCFTAVLDVDKLAAGNVTFGENSWRGDHYHDDMKAWIAKREAEG